MKLLISNSILDDVETAIHDALKANNNDPSDKTYLKIHSAKRNKRGAVIDADEDDIEELVNRAESKIETAIENLSEFPNHDPAYHRGQIRAWKALIRHATDR